MRVPTWIRAGMLTVLLASCGGGSEPGPPPTEAGDLVINYFQGGPDAGAILLTITGGPVQSVSVLSGLQLQVSSSTATPGTTRVIVSGSLHTGDILTFRVADISQWASYVVRTDQVADNVTFALIDPTVHQLTVHR